MILFFQIKKRNRKNINCGQKLRKLSAEANIYEAD